MLLTRPTVLCRSGGSSASERMRLTSVERAAVPPFGALVFDEVDAAARMPARRVPWRTAGARRRSGRGPFPRAVDQVVHLGEHGFRIPRVLDLSARASTAEIQVVQAGFRTLWRS